MKMFLLFLAATAVHGEFLKIELAVENMDCISCTKSLAGVLKKIKGVQTVQIDASKGAIVTLLPGNTLRLDRIRDAVKGVGFMPRGANVTVKGTPVTGDGKWRFDIEGLSQQYGLTSNDNGMLGNLRGSEGKVITVEGYSPLPADPRTMPTLEALAIK
jgi:copper chaperone CopZ